MKARTRSEEQGSMLIELVVVTLILSIIGGVVLSATLSAFRSSAATTARIDALQELELAMWQVTRDLRAADPLEFVIGSHRTALGASYDRNDERVDVTYSAETRDGITQLVRDDTGRSLVTALDNELVDELELEPVFVYLDRFGKPIECTTTCDVDLFATRQVRIRFVRRIDGSSPAIVETQVSVRNMRHGEEP